MTSISPAGRLKSGGSDKWGTPLLVYEKLNDEFNFDIDVCADKTNHKHKNYLTENDNALKLPWFGLTCFCNPPYSDVPAWVRKSYDESRVGATVVLLIPASTDTNYWHQFIFPFAEIRFIRGRINFIPPAGVKSSSNARGSAIVIFRPDQNCQSGICFNTWHP